VVYFHLAGGPALVFGSFASCCVLASAVSMGDPEFSGAQGKTYVGGPLEKNPAVGDNVKS
jgi:hypothetical protein